ncbi:hypothetical protein RUM43_012368 [Polyplax serrata]|uniref:Uncharacterized protein n=1 Tax=Polyplax serrata TaxID=468196 RepID=A0AAN8NS54_POLSC
MRLKEREGINQKNSKHQEVESYRVTFHRFHTGSQKPVICQGTKAGRRLGTRRIAKSLGGNSVGVSGITVHAAINRINGFSGIELEWESDEN